MIQRDFLQQQIEQLGRILGKVIHEITGMGFDGDLSIIVMKIDEILNEYPDLKIMDIIPLDDDDFITILEKTFHSDSGLLNRFSEMLLAFAKMSDDLSFKKKVLKKSLLTLEYASDISSTYCLDRNARIQELKTRIQSL